MVISQSLQGKKNETITRCWALAQSSRLHSAASCIQSSPLLTSRTSFHMLSAQALLHPALGEEQRRRVVETKYRGFIPLHVFSAYCNTNWLWKIGSENEYSGHCSLLLCCEITSWMKILNIFERKYITTLKWKSRGNHKGRKTEGYKGFIPLNVSQAELLFLLFVCVFL